MRLREPFQIAVTSAEPQRELFAGVLAAAVVLRFVAQADAVQGRVPGDKWHER